MKPLPPTALAFGAVAFTAVVLAAIGAPHNRPAPVASTTQDAPPPPTTVSGRGVTLASTSVELPDDGGTYPDGPHADVINGNCTSCHSASMALVQPPLSADQWKAEVTKMREVYKAPVAEENVPAILAYLINMPTQKTGPKTGKAQDPDPKVAPDVSGGSG